MTREDGGLPHICLEPRMVGDRVGGEDLGAPGWETWDQGLARRLGGAREQEIMGKTEEGRCGDVSCEQRSEGECLHMCVHMCVYAHAHAHVCYAGGQERGNFSPWLHDCHHHYRAKGISFLRNLLCQALEDISNVPQSFKYHHAIVVQSLSCV